ncbi:dystrophin isoform X2 [Tetranychus urticae]|uniref:dystrophin isoform X2 n=1 Tax=Tetranychus urticae TaxID=32264 RepID=UPI00077BE082|nr:dystrophin isoform X2 [Tetranychus urticae]
MDEDLFRIENRRNMRNMNNENGDDEDDEDDEISEFKAEVTEALGWILDAEEKLIDIDLMDKSLPEVKEIFRAHEEFINKLGDIQIEVGKLLSYGQDIVDSEECPPDEIPELELQMNLLNERLEQLSLKALEFRKNIHETLMIMQQKQINHLRNWLFSAEDRLSKFTDFGSDLASLKKQMADYQNFQQDVNVQEEIVDSLRNLVWIYDDFEGSSSPTVDNPPDELQDQLAPLAEKWNNVRTFISERTEILEEIVNEWEKFEEGDKKFNHWRAKLDRRLREMEEAAADMHIGSSFVGELVKRLERMEAEMDRQRSLYVKLGENASQLMDKVGRESAAGSVIAKKMETLKEVWDATVQRMGTLSHVVTKINEASLDELSTDDTGEESMTEGNEQEQVEGKSHHLQQQQQKQKTTPTTSNMSSSSSKKRRLDSWLIQEWQKALDVFTTWLSSVEEVLCVEDENESCSTSWDQMPLDEQQIILEDTESDLELRKQEFDSLVTQGNEFVEDLDKYGEDGSRIHEIVEGISERWCEVNRTLRSRKLRHKALVRLDQMVSETDAMSRALESAKKFVETTDTSDKSPDVLKKIDKNCKLRLNALSTKEDKVSKLRKELEDLKQTLPTATKEPSYQTIVNFFDFREDVYGQLCDLDKKVSEGLDNIKISDELPSETVQDLPSNENGAPSEVYDSVKSLHQWLSRLKETKFSAKSEVFFDLMQNKNQLEQYYRLRKELDNEGKNLKVLQETCKDILKEGLKDDWVTDMKDKLHSSQEIWDFCHNELENKVKKLSRLESSLTSFQEEISTLEEEIMQLNSFLDALCPAMGDVQTIESDVEQCNKVLNDIEGTLESNCSEIVLKGQEMIAEFGVDTDADSDKDNDNDKNATQRFEERLDKLKEKCSTVRIKAFDKKLELETALIQSKNVCKAFEKLERDFESLSFETDEVRHSVVEDYQKNFKSGRSLQDKIRKSLQDANKLQRQLNSLAPSPQPTTESLEEMKNKTKTIKESLQTLVENIEEYLTTLKQNHSKFGEFTRLIMMEKDWLDKLDRKLKRSPQTDADAEEISGNMDDLETYLRHRPANRSERIHKLANELITVGFFSDSVEAEIAKVDQRWKNLQHQAQQRLQDLEASIKDAQQCDSQILKVQRWIQDVDYLLQQRFDDDILAEDMPDEVEKLDNEFKSNKEILDKLTESIENYRSQERLEAASRLGEQLAILKTQYEELVMKFKRYQNPTDFETRLNKLSKTLNELMDSLIDLKVTSHEFEELDDCLKVIKEIDNLREEIDKVKKQAKLALDCSDEPDELRRKVDELEEIYDNLHRMAIERKDEMENAMETSKTVMNLMVDLKTWLNHQEDPSSVDPFELSRKKENLKDLNEKVQSLYSIVINGDNKLKENIETIQSDFEILEEKMSRKTRSVDKIKDDHEKFDVLQVKKQSETMKSSGSISKHMQLGHQRSIDLSEGIDSNQSSPKSTTSRKGSLSRTVPTNASLPSDSKTVKLLNFFTLLELENMHQELRNIQTYLDTSELLNKGDFMEYRQQSGALKKIQNTMDSLKPKINKMVLRESFMKRHRRWWFAKETRIQYKDACTQINTFLEMAEKTLSSSRLPTGELNIEVAKKEDEPLRKAFNEHVPFYGTFQVMIKKIMADVPYGVTLKEEISIIDERWKAIARELAWRKERLHNENKNMNILSYWNQLEAWIEKVNTTLEKLNGKIGSFEMANILQNEVKFLEQELQTQWLNMMTIQLAPTVIIEKDVDSMEKNFFKLIVDLPEARISLDKYLTSFKVVARMLDEEIEWTSRHVEEEIDTEKPIPDANTHETNYEKLIVMLQEIESDANKFGHKPPSFLKEKMDCLKAKREMLQKKMRLNAEPSSREWFTWLDSQVDYICEVFRDCNDEIILDKLKKIVDRIEKQIDDYFDESNELDQENLYDEVNPEMEIMNKNLPNCQWNTLKEKTIALQIRLEANSGDELNQLLLSLRESIEWVTKKRTEFNSFGDIESDLVSLSKHQEDLTDLRLSLEKESPIIKTALMSGRSYLSKKDPQALNEHRGPHEVKKTARNIHYEVEKLNEKWSELLKLTDGRQRRLDDIMRKMISLQSQMDELSVKLNIAEMTSSKWIPINEIAVDQLHDALTELQIFKDNIYTLQMFVDQMNGSATRISGSQILLSDLVLNRLEELNARWKLIQISIEERRKNIEQTVIDHNSAQQRFLNAGVEQPWERAVAFNKVPYYINHATETTHWDHPKMTEIINNLNEFSEVKFAAYRTAMKLRSIQRHLCLDLIHLTSLIKIFDECGLNGLNDKLMNVPEIIACLRSIFEAAASGDQAIVINVPLSIDLCLNWLLNLYDTTNRTGFIRILSLKVGLVTLCKGVLEEKYKFMFRLIADDQGLVDERSLGILLHDLIQIPRLLGEVNFFGGTNVEVSVRSCFELVNRKSDVDSDNFLEWLNREPQSIVWLPVLHRLAAAEKAKHQSKCNVCKQFPIIGFRYKCLLCFNFDICQICFFSGRTTKNHKIIHPMQEYCLATSSGQDIKDFTRIIRNKFKSKRLKRHPKYGYLPVQTTENDDNETPVTPASHTLQHPDSLEMHSKLEMYASRLAEVELDNSPDRNFDSYDELIDENQPNAQFSQDFGGNLLSPGQIIATDQRIELESIINGLEQENRQLQAEYERLKGNKSKQINGKGSSNVHSDSHLYSTIGSLTRGGDILTVKAEMDPYASLISSQEDNLANEADQTTSKLEAKRIFLEERNKCLEATLKRLRQLLNKFPEPTSLSNTLRSTHSDYTNQKISTGRLQHSTNNSISSLRVNGSSGSHHFLDNYQTNLDNPDQTR